MQIHNRHEGTTRGRERKHFEQRFYIEHERKINGATAIGKAIANVMQIAWNEWIFNYFSLVIYYRFANLFLHRWKFPSRAKPVPMP